MRRFAIIFCSLLHLSLSQDEDTTVPSEDVLIEKTETILTRSGVLRGRRVTRDGQPHYEFLGVPFAEPPVGALRFQPPVPVRPWRGVLEADKDGFACVQPPSEVAPEMTSEDCLTLNIFTTNLTSTNRPVMLWIHGGGFSVGSKDLYRMRPLIEEDVILVTINYRLHVLGFLSFGNDVVSGNMGLRDQHLAIRWVRENIREFGGDPDRITIFGESAGAMSVQAQVISPLNTGLLAGAIAHSGSILFVPEESSVVTAVRVAEVLGCPTGLDTSTLQCLQGVDIKGELDRVSESDVLSLLTTPGRSEEFPFYPVTDSFSSNPFLPVDPLTALMTGQYSPVPYISGFVKNEGALVTLAISSSGKTGQEVLRVAEQTGSVLPYSIIGSDKTLMRLATQFYNHSAGDSVVELEQPAMDLLTDSWFGTYDQKSVELMSRHSRHVYNFYLTQKTNNSLWASGAELVDYTPTHGDDLTFLVNEKTLEDTVEFSEEERLTAAHMVRYWTNFAKYGEPSPVGVSEVPTWYPVTQDSKHYMELKAEPEARQDLLADRMYFWERMVWLSRQAWVDRKLLYLRLAEFLVNNNIEVVE